MAEPNVCTKCDRTWTALGEAHCTGCHLHFANEKSFDRHQIDVPKDQKYGFRCLTLEEIESKATTKRSGEIFPVFFIRPETGVITLFDPYRNERLESIMSASTKNAAAKQTAAKTATTTKTATKPKATKATTAKPKAEKRVCAEDGCKKVLQKKPGRGRWPVRCQKHGGTGLV